MKDDVKIYNIKAFIRKNLSGDLDVERWLRVTVMKTTWGNR